MVVAKGLAEYRSLRVVRSTLVVRWKGPQRAKARLCLRGDQVRPQDVYSSPTPYRSSLKTLISPSALFTMDILRIDITQAFVQSGTLAKKDQMLIIPPECLKMPWGGTILDKVNWKGQSSQYFLTQKPLYGLHDIPLRRFISISECLIKQGYHQCRSDICLFSFMKNGISDSRALLYVDDLLLCYSSHEAKMRFLSTISILIRGGRIS